MNICHNCEKSTPNPKYCSRSCSASKNNKISPKRVRKNDFCKICSVPVGKRRTKCDECRFSKDMTIKEAIYDNLHRSSAYALIRLRARSVMKSLNIPKVCINCNYKTHVETCHVKPICKFDENLMVSVVNSIIPMS